MNGLKEVLSRLEKLKEDVKGKPVRSALLSSANLVKAAAIRNAKGINDPKTAEDISKNIVSQFAGKTARRTGNIMYRIGVLGGAQSPDTAKKKRRRKGRASLAELGEISGKGKNNPGGDTFYWRFVEFGTERAQAHPFLLPALEDNADDAIARFQRSLNRWLDKYEKTQS